MSLPTTTSADFLWQTFSTDVTITDFKDIGIHRPQDLPGNSRILFLSQRPDLLSWFYVYLLDFSLLGNFIHHLALYQVSVRTLERIATPLPPSSTSLLTTCGSLHLRKYLWLAYLQLNSCHARHT